MKKIGVNTVLGVVSGVGVGYLLLKSKNIYVLMGMGLLGGIIATQIKPKNSDVDDYMSKVDSDLDSIEEEVDKSSFYGVNKEMQFDKKLGYHTPNGTITATEPKDFMDISFK